MTKMKRVLSLLLAVLMVAGLILVPVSAEGDETDVTTVNGIEILDEGGVTTGVSGLKMSKLLKADNDGNLSIQLEVYATGDKVITTGKAPIDFVLVLDVSGSMNEDYSTETVDQYTAYSNKYNSNLYNNRNNLYYQLPDGSYTQVTVTRDQKTTSTETRQEKTTNTAAYTARDTLYAKIDGTEVEVEVSYSWDFSYTYTYTYTLNGQETSKTSTGVNGTPPFTVYTKTTSTTTEYTYTYTYKDASGQTVTLGTSVGQNEQFTAATLYSKSSGETKTKSKLAALQEAVCGFVDTIAETSPDSQIALVKFANDIKGGWDDEGNDTGTQYNPDNPSNTGADCNYTQVVKKLTAAGSGAEALKNAVNSLVAKGATRSDNGMTLAKQIVENDPNKTRQKVVIMFTDGAPSRWSDWSESTANAAISTSKEIKAIQSEADETQGIEAKNTLVYTIGCFDGTPDDNTTKYMNRMSSNHPDATTYNDNSTKVSSDYYKVVSANLNLSSIFQDIASANGGSNSTLTGTAVVRDVVSSAFDLPENSGEITVTAYACTGKDANGCTFADTDSGTMGAKVEVDGKTVNVTGFDFAENWCGTETTNGTQVTAHGYKLVITIPITDNGSAYGEAYTNGDAFSVEDKSGVYTDKNATEEVALFERPLVNFPYFQVGHIESKVDTDGANYGEQNGELKKYRVYENTPFDLVDKVTEGYLYGGAFSTADCDAENVQKFENGENALNFTPKAGATYYIWEVPNSYLPANIYTMHKENGEGVTRIYMLTATDRALYREVGFDLGNDATLVSGTAGSGIANKDGEITNLSNGVLYGTIQVTKMGAKHEEVYLNSSNGNKAGQMKTTNKTGFLAEGAYHDEGCIGGYRLPQDVFKACQNDADGFTFQSYWVTLDGIKVYGLNQAKVTYEYGNNKATASRTLNVIDPAPVDAASSASVQLMAFAPVAVASDEEVETAVTLTVHDNGSVYTQSIDEAVSYAGAEGQLFAGWFLDEDYTTPVDFESISESTDIYAKYVSDSYLQVKYNKLGLFRVSGVSLVSAVDDPANYAQVGILVNGEPVSVSQSQRYMLIFTAASLFDGASRSDTLLTAQLSLSGSGSLEVTPYWVTLDGSTVYGQSRTLTYTARSIQG